VGGSGTTRDGPIIPVIEEGLGPLELQVLRAVTQLSFPVTVRDVCEALARDGYFAYQGVLSSMNRLVQKGILESAPRGAADAYQPRM
jgi:predicted transcriptional regulator